MPFPEHRRLPDMRALFESSDARYAVAHFGQRAVILLEGDACDTVMCVEQRQGAFLAQLSADASRSEAKSWLGHVKLIVFCAERPARLRELLGRMR